MVTRVATAGHKKGQGRPLGWLMSWLTMMRDDRTMAIDRDGHVALLGGEELQAYEYRGGDEPPFQEPHEYN